MRCHQADDTCLCRAPLDPPFEVTRQAVVTKSVEGALQLKRRARPILYALTRLGLQALNGRGLVG